MPANYALRAVALGAGRHRLRLEYAPRGFHLWALSSAIAWAAWVGAAASSGIAKGGWRVPELSVVVPAFRERANIPALLQALEQALAGSTGNHRRGR